MSRHDDQRLADIVAAVQAIDSHLARGDAILREGLEDTFTVRRLGLSDRLARTLTNTTPSSR